MNSVFIVRYHTHCESINIVSVHKTQNGAVMFVKSFVADLNDRCRSGKYIKIDKVKWRYKMNFSGIKTDTIDIVEWKVVE